MAKRAFLWSLSDPTAWLDPSTNPHSSRPLISRHFGQLWDWSQSSLSPKGRQKIRKDALKGQRSVLKKPTVQQGHYFDLCTYCKKELQQLPGDEQRCARCLTSHCSKTCQHADWPSHKITCQSRPQGKTRISRHPNHLPL